MGPPHALILPRVLLPFLSHFSDSRKESGFHSFDLRHALATSLQTCSSSYRSCSQKRTFLPPQNPVFSTIPWHQTTRAAPCPPKRPEHTWIQRLMKWCPVVPPDHPLGLEHPFPLLPGVQAPGRVPCAELPLVGQAALPKVDLPRGNLCLKTG